MQSAARNLEFEKAANARDQIKFLKEKIYGANIQDKIKQAKYIDLKQF